MTEHPDPMGEADPTGEGGDLGFSVRQRIDEPVDEVFDAVVDPEKLCAYFTATASGPLVAGTTVRWSWAGGEEDDTHVLEVDPGSRILLAWKAFRVEYRTTCEFLFEPTDDDATVVTVTETGWRNDEAGRRSSYEHCCGWTHMLLCLKARIEHGIDLR